MNFGELKAYVLADAHVLELADDVADFIARGEDFLSSKLRSTEQDATTTLDDTHRSGPESGIYTLPAGVLELRRSAICGSRMYGRMGGGVGAAAHDRDIMRCSAGGSRFAASLGRGPRSSLNIGAGSKD